MSWFSEIASKAEAMLVKLDQDAAVVLQNPEENISGSKILTTALSSVSAYRNDVPVSNNDNVSDESIDTTGDSENTINTQSIGVTPSIEPINLLQTKNQLGSQTASESTEIRASFINDPTTKISYNTPTEFSPDRRTLSEDQFTGQGEINGYSKKFTIRVSRSNLFAASPEQRSEPSQRASDKNHIVDRTNNLDKKSKDIRDSIKRSLREYVSQTSFSPRTIDRYESSQSSSFTHFDNQPNLVRHTSQSNDHYDNEERYERPGQSPSLSIDVPDDDGFSANRSNDIAARLLRDTVAKQRSLSYIHEIMNRLTSPDRQAALIDQAKFKLRRVQLRGTSYARRLNYYFRAYPMMKYAMLIYLIVMQLLVVYVLFFYQSSGGSPGDFSSNVDELNSDKML